jgi:hypothetical protein
MVDNLQQPGISAVAAMWKRLKFYGVSRLFSKTDHYEDAADNFLKS